LAAFQGLDEFWMAGSQINWSVAIGIAVNVVNSTKLLAQEF
jgi:hypothetical protein